MATTVYPFGPLRDDGTSATVVYPFGALHDVSSGPPPSTSIPVIMNYYRQMRSRR